MSHPAHDTETVRRAALETLSAVPETTPIAVALSGGVDSTALALILAGAGRRVTAVHVNHHLHPGCHDAEATAQATARALALPSRVVHLDPRPLRADRRGVEAAARTARYAALAEVAEPGAAIATGHTRDDRLETMLMRLEAGTGVVGLSGPARVTQLAGRVVLRPLLDAGRRDTEAICRAAGISAYADPMNADERYHRARVRAGAARGVEALSGPGLGRSLARLERDAEALTWLVGGALSRCARRWGDHWFVRAAALETVPTSVREALVFQVIRSVCPRPAAGFVAEVAALALRGAGAADGHGARAERAGDFVWVAAVPSRTRALALPPFAEPLSAGAVVAPTGTLRVRAVTGDAARPATGRWVLDVPCGADATSLVLRSLCRHAGCGHTPQCAEVGARLSLARGGRRGTRLAWVIADAGAVYGVVGGPRWAPGGAAAGLRCVWTPLAGSVWVETDLEVELLDALERLPSER